MSYNKKIRDAYRKGAKYLLAQRNGGNDDTIWPTDNNGQITQRGAMDRKHNMELRHGDILLKSKLGKGANYSNILVITKWMRQTRPKYLKRPRKPTLSHGHVMQFIIKNNLDV